MGVCHHEDVELLGYPRRWNHAHLASGSYNFGARERDSVTGGIDFAREAHFLPRQFVDPQALQLADLGLIEDPFNGFSLDVKQLGDSFEITTLGGRQHSRAPFRQPTENS